MFIKIIGIFPAFIFPIASIMQCIHMLRVKSSKGNSLFSWYAFAVGNLCLYIYTEKYFELQSIIALLGTALVQVYVIFLIYKYRENDDL